METGPTQDDLVALVEAVQEAARLEPPRSADIRSSWIYFDLGPDLFNQLTEWQVAAAQQLGQKHVYDADVLRELVQMLVSDTEVTARVISALRDK